MVGWGEEAVWDTEKVTLSYYQCSDIAPNNTPFITSSTPNRSCFQSIPVILNF